MKVLTENILTSSFHKIAKNKYFTAIPTKADSAWKHHLYLQVLKTLRNIEIIYGKHKRRRIKGKLIKYDPKLNKEIITNKTVKIFKPEEKETDVNIASHIVYDSCKENIDCVVLLSNDTDLKTPLNFVKYRLKKKVVIITPTTLTRRFNSWFDILERAGLENSRSRLNITEEQLFSNLLDVWTKLGKQPTYTDMNNKEISKYSAKTYENRFKSWTKALLKFENFMNSTDSIPNPNNNKDTKNLTPSRAPNLRDRYKVLKIEIKLFRRE